MGKQSKTVIGCFSFVCLFRNHFAFFHHLWLTFRDPALEESELMSLHHLIFCPNSGSKTSLSCFLDVSVLGTSFANAKVKVIYEISCTLSLWMSCTFPLRTSTPPPIHPSAPAFPSTLQHGWIIFISNRTGHHLQCLNDKKIFLERMCQSGTAESQRPSRWYLQLSSLTKHACYLLTSILFFATGNISTAAESQSTKEIPTYVNGWIEDTNTCI